MGRCDYEVGEADGVEEVGEVAAGDGEAGEAAGGCGEGCVEAGEVAEDEEGVGEGVGSGEREWSASKKDKVLFMKLTTLVDGLEGGIVEGVEGLGKFGAVGEGEVGERVVEELVRGGGGKGWGFEKEGWEAGGVRERGDWVGG